MRVEAGQVWRPDAEPWEALNEAEYRAYVNVRPAYKSPEDVTDALGEMGWRLAPRTDLVKAEKYAEVKDRCAELEAENERLREAAHTGELYASMSEPTGLRRGHLADLEVVEAILLSDPRERASRFDVEPRAMAEAVRAMIDNPELHNPGSFTHLSAASVPVPEGDGALSSPEEVAVGAMNRLCAYDGESAPGDYAATMRRVRGFMGRFVELAADRLAQAVSCASVPVEEPDAHLPSCRCSQVPVTENRKYRVMSRRSGNELWTETVDGFDAAKELAREAMNKGLGDQFGHDHYELMAGEVDDLPPEGGVIDRGDGFTLEVRPVLPSPAPVPVEPEMVKVRRDTIEALGMAATNLEYKGEAGDVEEFEDAVSELCEAAGAVPVEEPETPESYDKHEGSPDSPQTRHNSAPEIKVGQRVRAKDTGELGTVVKDASPYHPGTFQVWLDDGHVHCGQDVVKGYVPLPSLDLEGKAQLDERIAFMEGMSEPDVYDHALLRGLREARDLLVKEAENGE